MWQLFLKLRDLEQEGRVSSPSAELCEATRTFENGCENVVSIDFGARDQGTHKYETSTDGEGHSQS